MLELTTTAGRFLTAVWLEKGNGTRRTSPKSKLVIDGVFGVVPDPCEGLFGKLRGGSGQKHVGPLVAQELDEILDFVDLLGRKGLDLLDECEDVFLGAHEGIIHSPPIP